MGGIFPVREWAIQVSGNSINSRGAGFPETGGAGVYRPRFTGSTPRLLLVTATYTLCYRSMWA
jgi:hypothetical protein